MATTTATTTGGQVGLLGDCTGFDASPSGPWGLARGGLVRHLRPDGDGWTSLEYSRDGRRWIAVSVSDRELQVGDVSAIRADLRAPRPVPPPPDGAARFVWCYVADADGARFDYRVGRRPEAYRSPSWVPTRWHSCHAFSEAGEFLGYFSPHYASPHYEGREWRRPGDPALGGIADSIDHAAITLLGRRGGLSEGDRAVVYRHFD